MIRITRETDYGIVLLAYMARDGGQSYSAASLAQHSKLSAPMVSKILKTLTRAGLLVSQRGAHGGYRLARAPRDISAAEVIGVLEGPIAITECSPGVLGSCVHEGHCTVSNHWQRINHAVYEALNKISLADMSFPAAAPVTLSAQAPAKARTAESNEPITKLAQRT